MTRPYIPLKNKLAAMVADRLELSFAQRKKMTASDVLALVEWDHIEPIATGGPIKAFWNLQMLTPAQHKAKTHAATGNSDRRFIKLFRRKAKREKPRRKIPSRPMPCGKNSPHKMKLRGREVVARD